MSRLSRLNISARICNLGVKPDAARPLARLLSRFFRPYSRLSRLNISARLCNLSLNPDAAQPLARLVSRHSRPYVLTFQTENLGAIMQFESKAGWGATLGASHSRHSRHFSRLSRLKLSSRLGNLGLNPDAAPTFTRLMSRLSRPFVQTFHIKTLGATLHFWSNSRCGATRAFWVLIQMRRDHWRDSCLDFPDLMSRHSRLKR